MTAAAEATRGPRGDLRVGTASQSSEGGDGAGGSVTRAPHAPRTASLRVLREKGPRPALSLPSAAFLSPAAKGVRQKGQRVLGGRGCEWGPVPAPANCPSTLEMPFFQPRW